MKLSDIAEEIRYVKLETSPESLIGKIDKFIIYKKRIYIMDEMRGGSLYCFDINGKFIFRIEKTGKGPGEYLALHNFTIDTFENQITIVDQLSSKLLRYSLDGEYIDEINANSNSNRIFIALNIQIQ